MLNFHIIKVNLKNGEIRYRTILTQSGKNIKSKTFRRKQDARTWGNCAVLDSQEYEAKGIKPCTILFSRLADEYMKWWTGKDHDRARLVLWWEKCLGKTLLSDITPELIRDALKSKKSQAPATYNKHLAVLSAIMDYAILQQEDDSILEQYIDDNWNTKPIASCAIMKTSPSVPQNPLTRLTKPTSSKKCSPTSPTPG